MAVARAQFESNRTQLEAAREVGTSQARVSYANVVLEHAPDLAAGVLAGARPLDDAYATATATGARFVSNRATASAAETAGACVRVGPRWGWRGRD
jgi:prolyl-tRNA editing enzyme YbaK/EbsC (Cys-tRNA(Pro) deacylase)